jgi:hypothetical protein
MPVKHGHWTVGIRKATEPESESKAARKERRVEDEQRTPPLADALDSSKRQHNHFQHCDENRDGPNGPDLPEAACDEVRRHHD